MGAKATKGSVPMGAKAAKGSVPMGAKAATGSVPVAEIGDQYDSYRKNNIQ